MPSLPSLDLLDQLPDVVWRADSAGIVTYINPADESLRGFPATETIGRPLTATMDENSADAFRQACSAAVSAGTFALRLDVRQRRADGTLIWVGLRATILRNRDGAMLGSCGVNREIASRKQADSATIAAADELSYERDLLATLLESSPDDIYFKDLESRIVRMSRSKALRLVQRVPRLKAELEANPEVDPVALVVGITDFDTYAKEDAQIAFEDEQAIIRTGNPLVNKLEKQVYKDGRTVWYLTHKLPWRDRSGKIIGTFGVSKDVTDLKRAEQELEKVTKELVSASRDAGMAEVATGVLHNVGNAVNSVNVAVSIAIELVRASRIQQLAKLIDVLEQHRDDLAHFLTADERGDKVLPYLKALQSAIADENSRILAELEQTRKGVDHIKEIVTMQQAYATTAGVVEPVPLREVVEDAVRLNSAALDRHGVTLERQYRDEVVVATDRHKVLQILVNVLRNAKYACDESGRSDKKIVIEIRAGDGAAEINIVDNGVGIPADLLTKIFAHGYTTRKGGHGFGLHSGALAASELGGTLTAKSDGPGCGAAFRLRLPSKDMRPTPDGAAVERI